MEDSVTLIVKTANQRVEDHTVQCNVNWTIRRLKDHLSEVYPSKPKIEHQRLIYYGQMLSDDATLREVLNKYGTTESTHTLHLVFKTNTPDKHIETSSFPPASPINNPTTSPNMPQSWFQQPNLWASHPNYGYLQQLAAHQAYLNYYRSQYMEMLARQRGGIQPNAYVFGFPNYEMPRLAQQQQQPPQPQQPPAANQEEEEGVRNRDWLDYAHVFSRLLVLFSIVYFYSSPARFLIVSFLGFFLYLYHIGFFRLPLQIDNNNEILNNNAAAINNNNNLQEVPAAGVVNNNNLPNQNDNRENAETEQAAAVEVQPSIIALAWTFLSSFFTSLIPENPNVI